MERLAGETVRVGLAWATVLPDIDFETYSEAGYVWNPDWTDRWGNVVGKWQAPPGVNSTADAGLPSVGAAVYSEHPSCEVLTCSYDLKDGRGKRRWRPGLPLPQDLFDHIAAGGLLEAHNAGFEWWIWYNVCRVKYGWPMIPAAQQRCSAAKARAFGLPGSLDPLGKVLNTSTKKDEGGKDLIKLFSIPRQPDKKDARRRVMLEDEPLQAVRFFRYCDTDIETESEVSQRVPDLSPSELEWWQIDQLINRRGVHVDSVTIDAGIAIIEQAFERYNAELRELTGGYVQRASELQKLKEWLQGHGFHMDGMAEDDIDAALKRLDDAVTSGNAHPMEVQPLRRALELRQLVGSASVKKLYAMRNQATKQSRLHELYMYHAARTGRPTGNGPQPTNLPNSGPEVRVCPCGRHFALSHTACPWCARAVPPPPPAGMPDRTVTEWNPQAAEDAIACIQTRDLSVVEHYFGNAVAAVSGSLRGMFTAAPGYDLICSDYSAIEAVVLAELAGEQWRIDLFKARGKIYEASGAKVQGLSLDEVLAYRARTGMHHPCRKSGKVLELACGFGGWIGALRAFGADEFMTEDEMKSGILAWRGASPMIVRLWGGQFVDSYGMPCPSFFRDARPSLTGLEGMAISAVMYPGTPFAYRGIEYIVVDDVLYCTLLSGRRLAYHRPRLAHSDRGGVSLSYEGWNTNPKMGKPGWVRMDTYSGKLTENVVQATARDIFAPAVIRLWRAGYHTVLHVYDEIVAEVPTGWGSIEEFERLMSIMPAFAEGWPVYATDGWRGPRYRK